MTLLKFQNPGSFRDKNGYIFEINSRIFRGIKKSKAKIFSEFLNSNFYKENVNKKIVSSKKISSNEILKAGLPRHVINNFELWVEHDRIDFITYPYEWSFNFLKKAAILYLDLFLDALSNDYKLKDASAYNVQFIGCNPIFIDTLSFEPYEDGDNWLGYKQFCEHFLAPLALASYGKVNFNSLFRGSPDGINIIDSSKLLPLRTYFSFTLLGNIHLHAKAIAKISSASTLTAKRNHPLPKKNLIALLNTFKNFIAKLQPQENSYWINYDLKNSYTNKSTEDKKEIITKFIISENLSNILDIGCNSGYFSDVALKSGAKRVIGLDVDAGAINLASKREYQKNKVFLPLLYDFTNPSPSLGWGLKERASLDKRLPKIDGLICLALIHHIVIGKNIPIEDFIDWLIKLSPVGIIEFVPKDDPMVKGLLSNREDIFPEYTEEYFIKYLKREVKITQIYSLKDSKRKLIVYERKFR